jgi:pimeloyl-ACP methyl ester carboxylesterase
MTVIKHWIAIICLLNLIFASSPSQAQRAKRPRGATRAGIPMRFVDIGGYKLRFQVAGNGGPTVVFDSGIGDTLDDWDDVFPAVARLTRAVRYDRAGNGKSEPGPEPRSHTRIASELHSLLHKANIAPPYLLVGHSLGGANIRAFANLYEDEVAGLVFVDPLTERIFSLASKQAVQEDMAQQEKAAQNAPVGWQGEWRFAKGEVLHGFPELTSFGKPPDVPMMILIAGRGRPPHWVKALLEQYGPWTEDFSEARLMVIPDSGHYIQRDDPAMVISAIRRVMFPSVEVQLARTIKSQGVPAAVNHYRQMRKRYPTEYFHEGSLNRLGYQQLSAHRVEDAIALFKLNVEMYPQSFNVYDSLGEAYMVHGDRSFAIKNYRKSLALNPRNTNAVEMLKRLRAEP